MNTLSKEEILNNLVGQILRIEQIVWGRPEDKYLVRYQGQLQLPSQEAYDKLAQSLEPHQITPLFRKQDGKHIVILQEGLFHGKPTKIWVNILLFALTVISVIFAGILASYTGPVTSDLAAMWVAVQPSLGRAFAFTASLLGILLTHEFGHYFAARSHGTAVTLPYFIPFPLNPLGTMGAFISLQEPPKNKRVLLDIGLAGPLAGFIVAVPITILGLWLSSVEKLPAIIPAGFGFEGNSILYLLLKYLVHGEWLPLPASYGGLAPILYWIRYFFIGTPLPSGGLDVVIHPVAWAGWAGLFVTGLNLLPCGQLDGGHLIYVLLGRKAKKILPFIIGGLVLLGTAWSGWWLWVFLILIFGRAHAEPLDQITELDPKRKFFARLGLVIFVLVFIPIPMIVI
ncbi:MAG: site-2 protease family protein [Chloroflexota bacterium]|nr:MAG: site-2 protease family protein [Chloroflexota bacterium]